ncbi:protein of unknown function [Methylorubrum extorquens]|uniref:Transposase n=1 Tax=Methylorubrum extorquens TaxID=408 RepID=A0A2N9ALK2_METEX|nr:protein of unknown function [Methylorubrum extorquens]
MPRIRFTERAVCLCSVAGRERYLGGRGLPEDGRVRTDVSSLEEAVRRHGRPEIRRLKQLEDENSKLKRLVADLTLDRSMRQDVAQAKVVRLAAHL